MPAPKISSSWLRDKSIITESILVNLKKTINQWNCILNMIVLMKWKLVKRACDICVIPWKVLTNGLFTCLLCYVFYVSILSENLFCSWHWHTHLISHINKFQAFIILMNIKQLDNYSKYHQLMQNREILQVAKSLSEIKNL